jgi:hypothetical protein
MLEQHKPQYSPIFLPCSTLNKRLIENEINPGITQIPHNGGQKN